MDNKSEGTQTQGCGCSRGGSCHCWAGIAVGLWLFLVGGIIGFAIGHCSRGYGYYHHMMECPITMPAAPPTK